MPSMQAAYTACGLLSTQSAEDGKLYSSIRGRLLKTAKTGWLITVKKRVIVVSKKGGLPIINKWMATGNNSETVLESAFVKNFD